MRLLAGFIFIHLNVNLPSGIVGFVEAIAAIVGRIRPIAYFEFVPNSGNTDQAVVHVGHPILCGGRSTGSSTENAAQICGRGKMCDQNQKDIWRGKA
jgi:hypothetical protein